MGMEELCAGQREQREEVWGWVSGARRRRRAPSQARGGLIRAHLAWPLNLKR